MDMGKFLGFVTATRVAHWNADTVTEEHEALGGLYSSMAELVDDYAEIFMGKNGGKISLTPSTCPYESNAALLDCGQEIVAGARESAKPGKDDDLLNILADMDTAINKARYLLKVSSKSESTSPAMTGIMGRVQKLAK